MTDPSTLFDMPPAAATNDPATSHDAAREVTRSGARGEHCRRVLKMVQAHQGLTAVELHNDQTGDFDPDAEPLDRHEISRRLADLKNVGLVRQGPSRPCRIKHRVMSTWFAIGGVDAGNSTR
jgi:hypothetical protein